MKKEFIEHSMFLCNYISLKEFSLNFVNNFKINKNKHWSIVCERKEDLITIRNQIFYEIGTLDSCNKNYQTLYGISMYTLDNLARNFCASIAATSFKKFRNEIPRTIFQPYLDIINQEKLVEFSLKMFNYFNNDSLPIAKQILSLIDIQWPENISFANLIIETQSNEHIKNVQEINEISLKQILATYQFSKDELQNFCRLQSFINDYLNKEYINHLTEDHTKLTLPINFLQGNILWVSAPEYLTQYNKIENINKNNYSSFNTIKPGNFQNSIVEDFKKCIEKTRSILNITDTFFWTNKTIIKDSFNEMKVDEKNIYFQVALNEQSFITKIDHILEETEQFALLADYDPGQLKLFRHDAAGKYEVTEKMISNWNTKNLAFSNCNEIYPQLDSYLEEFTDYISLIENKEKLEKIANVYSISTKINKEYFQTLLKNFLEQQTVQIGNSHKITELPKALSFFNSITLPQKVIAIGRAHAATSSSFNVKVLNNAISLLRKNGVAIDLPASEIMYKGFWKNICNSEFPIVFILNNSSELENFPEYITPKNNIDNFGIEFKYNSSNRLTSELCKSTNSFLNWQAYLVEHKNKISITSFEKYINCPLNFYLLEVLKLKKEPHDFFKADQLQIGSQMHLICEQLISRLVTTLGNQYYNKIMPSIYAELIINLQSEELFLSHKKSEWQKSFATAIHKNGYIFSEQILFAFQEALDLIWDNDNNEFKDLQKREILKRTFLRFITLEKLHSQNHPETYIGIERERPISIKIEGLELSGKIDRIDCFGYGIQIIDYKTANIPKTEKKLVILPSELKKPKNKSAKLSVQGALYSLAWANKHLLLEEEDQTRSQIHSFSLFHLKNLDLSQNPILSYEFTDPLKKNSSFYLEILNEYSQYALNLKNGKFEPNPLKLSNCNFCDFKLICPLKINSLQNDDSQAE